MDFFVKHWKVILFVIILLAAIGIGIFLLDLHGFNNYNPPFPIPTTCPNNCTNRGQCVGGLCTCNDGYAGIDCGIICPGKVTTCPDPDPDDPNKPCYCSGHGTCSLKDGTCLCKPGWKGD